MKMKMPVIFRADKENGTLWITAVFPTEPATNDGGFFTIYQHIGQHGAGSIAWYRRTRPATPEEYQDLLTELREIYGTSHSPGDPIVELQVVSRMTRAHLKARRDAVREMRK